MHTTYSNYCMWTLSLLIFIFDVENKQGKGKLYALVYIFKWYDSV